MPPFFPSTILNTIADALVDKGYIILDIDNSLIIDLAKHVKMIEGFDRAFVGRNSQRQEVVDIRSDRTLWLDENNSIDTLYLKEMHILQEGVNQRLYMGLRYHEAHYAHYISGSFYKKHLDAFKGKDSRKLTTVLYLNQEWQQEDGGALVIYGEKEEAITTVMPTMGRMVIFLSDKFPHEVKPAKKDRYSIAGWFRID